MAARARPGRRLSVVLFVTLLALLYAVHWWQDEQKIRVRRDPSLGVLPSGQIMLSSAHAPSQLLTQPPLHAEGRDILDAHNQRFKLASVNWFGASDKLFIPAGLETRHRRSIAQTIRKLGFNSVRLPYADEMVTTNPRIGADLLAANNDLAGQHALDVYHAVVKSLTDEGLAVVINNHITQATWCCGANPCDGGWANDHLGSYCRVSQTEEQWIENWVTIMTPHVNNSLVIGADLRNEVRGLWGTMPWSKWAAAAEHAGHRLLSVNPNWLIIVGGTSSNNDLSGVRTRPVDLPVRGRLIYSSHVYSWSGWGSLGGRYSKRPYDSFAHSMWENWGYLLEDNIAPVWVGEFGAPPRPSEGDWNYWQHLMQYLKAVDADFGYWSLNAPRDNLDDTATYGLLDHDWETPKLDYRLQDMHELMTGSR